MFEYLKRGHEGRYDFVSSQELNRLGSEGWELVSVVISRVQDVEQMIYFFKRGLVH